MLLDGDESRRIGSCDDTQIHTHRISAPPTPPPPPPAPPHPHVTLFWAKPSSQSRSSLLRLRLRLRVDNRCRALLDRKQCSSCTRGRRTRCVGRWWRSAMPRTALPSCSGCVRSRAYVCVCVVFTGAFTCACACLFWGSLGRRECGRVGLSIMLIWLFFFETVQRGVVGWGV